MHIYMYTYKYMPFVSAVRAQERPAAADGPRARRRLLLRLRRHRRRLQRASQAHALRYRAAAPLLPLKGLLLAHRKIYLYIYM